jgi:predicted GH43/DUF377 family glycosyl hydrolase
MELQHWHKHGCIFSPPSAHGWIKSHAQIPTPDWTADGGLRIYYGVRDAQNRTSTIFLEIDPEHPTKVIRQCDTPVLPLGALGCFDDAGVMPACVVNVGEQKYLYYIGWNTSMSVPFHNSIGLAISEDAGVTYHRAFDGPLLDRTAREPYFCASSFVLRDGPTWRMWYLSCTEWTCVQGKPEARYLIRYAESNDGIEWRRPGTIAIDYARPDEAIARPWVVKDGSEYRMWYSSRSISDYRRNPRNGYCLGYATSSDGISWKRQDELVDLPVSKEGWDAEMIAYPAVIDIRQRRYLLYNGNGFGASGFGIAELSGS